MRDQVNKTDEFKRLEEAIRADEVIGPLVGQRLGSSLVISTVASDCLAWRLLGDALELSPTEAVSRMRAVISQTTDEFTGLLPLVGLRLDGLERVQLAGDVEIGSMTDDEIVAFLELGQLGDHPSLPGYAYVEHAVCARATRSAPRVVNLEEFPGGDARTAAHSAVQSVLDTLRLYRTGVIGSPGYLEVHPDSLFGGAGKTFVRYELPLRAQHASSTLSPDDVEPLSRIVELIQAARSGAHGKAIDLAIRRFGYAHQRSRDEDVVLDLMIALEGLVLDSSGAPKDRGELSFRVALGSCWLLRSQLDPKSVFRFVQKAYVVRSAIAHGGEPDPPDVRDLDGNRVELRAFADAFQDVVRRILLTCLERAATDGGWAWRDDLIAALAVPLETE